MKKLIFLCALLVSTTGLMVSCSDDDYSPNPPEITFPSNGFPQTLATGETATYSFSVTAPRGYVNHATIATGGTIVENSSAITEGETNFTITGQYTAGSEEGPGGITLTVVDRDGSSSIATIAVIVQNP